MLILQDLSYIHPNKDLLFENINLALNLHDKAALIGNNGAGKSTLFKIIAGELPHSGGQLFVDSQAYYVPQIFGQFNHLSIAQALHIEDKLTALREILKGNVTDDFLSIIGDDWQFEERCNDALRYWQLDGFDLSCKLENLSGGEKTKVFLAGISIHQPKLVLLDEPSNHLDVEGRKLLYDFIMQTSSTLMIVSHDRKLLNLLDTVFELSKKGITVYGGNYDFYAEQKQIESNALYHDIRSKEKSLKKATQKEREVKERLQKDSIRGKKKHKSAGASKMMMNSLKNKAEQSTSKTKSVHANKIGEISSELRDLRTKQPDLDKMKFDLNNSDLHKGKILFRANKINFGYTEQLIWDTALSFQIESGERIALKGANGSGKTSLINIVLGNLEPSEGSVLRTAKNTIYIDQDYSLINGKLSIYEQAEEFNDNSLPEHDIKIRLNRFLFPKAVWDKSCSTLSGGEKMRLMLCCLTISEQAPDIIILDEPTNNLDIQNIEILTQAINMYQGTLIVVSHDEVFLEEVNVERTIEL